MIRALLLVAALLLPLLALARAAPRLVRPASSNVPRRVAPPSSPPQFHPAPLRLPGMPHHARKPDQKLV